jgi:acyl-CoA thioester hydrolase
MNHLQLSDFPLQSYDKIRYADTDRQSHVNNSVFSTFLETGRVELLYNPKLLPIKEDVSFVIVNLNIHLIQEIIWPGRIEIGSGIVKIGNSSLQLYQCLFQNEICVAHAESTIVQVAKSSRKSTPFSQDTINVFNQFLWAPPKKF